MASINSKDGTVVEVGAVQGYVTASGKSTVETEEIKNIEKNNKEISYIGRSPDASPATGYAKWHISQQQEIIKKVFE